ncbi:MAG: DUF1622 domain-containing protein [Actinomycetales bacterium]
MSATVLLAAPHAAALDLLSEESLRSAVDLLVRLVEGAGALVIFVGALYAFFRFIIAGIRRKREEAFVLTRLGLGRFLALGLEFQLASDVLRTAIAPSFEEIGKLAAIAAIRTALNYFLAKEIAEEKEQVADHDDHGDESSDHDPSPAHGAGRTGVDLRDTPDTLAGSTASDHGHRRS